MDIKLLTRKHLMISSKIKKFNLLNQTPKELQILKEIYNKIPETECTSCGKCCESIPISSLEFYNIMSFIETFPPLEYKRLLDLLVYENGRYFETLRDGRRIGAFRCPFWDESYKFCLISPVRPIQCRIASIRKFNYYCKKTNSNYDEFIANEVQINDWISKIEKISNTIEDKEMGVTFKYIPIELWTRISRFGIRNTIQYISTDLKYSTGQFNDTSKSPGFISSKYQDVSEHSDSLLINNSLRISNR